MPTTLAPVTQDWLDSFVSTLEPGKVCEAAHSAKIWGFLPRPTWLQKNTIEKVIVEKVKVDKRIVEHSLRELTALLRKEEGITRLGLDYNQGDVFLWIEVRTVDHEKDISRKIREFNNQYAFLGIKVQNVFVDQFLGLEIPDDYKTIRL